MRYRRPVRYFYALNRRTVVLLVLLDQHVAAGKFFGAAGLHRERLVRCHVVEVGVEGVRAVAVRVLLRVHGDHRLGAVGGLVVKSFVLING